MTCFLRIKSEITAYHRICRTIGKLMNIVHGRIAEVLEWAHDCVVFINILSAFV